MFSPLQKTNTHKFQEISMHPTRSHTLVLLAPYFALQNTHTNFKQIVVITHTHKHKWPPIKLQSKKIQTSYQTSYQAQCKKFHTISNLSHFTSELFHTHLHFKPPTKLHLQICFNPRNCSPHTTNLQHNNFFLCTIIPSNLHTQKFQTSKLFLLGFNDFMNNCIMCIFLSILFKRTISPMQKQILMCFHSLLCFVITISNRQTTLHVTPWIHTR
jgi:hypothetical protein